MSNKPLVDSEALLATVDIVDVISKYTNLTKRSRDYVGICEFHDDKTESLEVSPTKQIFKCFACGAGGDAIAYLMQRGATFFDAVKELEGGNGYDGDVEKRIIKKKKPKTEWSQVRPVPTEAFANPPAFEHYIHKQPSRVWEWKNERGELLGYTCRFDLEDGEKEVLPYVYATDGKKSEWRFMGFGRPRALYNLDKLAANPEKTVVVFEGEKTCDAGQALLDTAVCVTWLGGSNGVHYTDWTPLKGRKVVYWPDNDAQGVSAMLHVNQLLNGETALSKFVHNPEDAPKGWDIADADWSPDAAKKYLRGNIFEQPEPFVGILPAALVEKHGEPVKIWTSEQDGCNCFYGFFKHRNTTEWRFLKAAKDVTGQDPEMLEPMEPEKNEPLGPYGDIETPDSDEDDEAEESPFKFLGFNKSESGGLAFYFYVIRPKTVVRLTASGISKAATLMQLAPLQWWEMKFPDKNGMSVNAAVNWLISASMAAGPYKDQLIRGRGAWLDSGRVVLHAGDHLIVDGAPKKLGTLDTKFIYEWGPEIGFNTYGPLKSKESAKLIDLLKMLNWEREISAHLLAGWCVIAPVCGALTWRPHIWLTGAAGTGKSWIFEKVVRPLLGETVLAVQGEATEAGVRQMLGTDALPVVFDEAEGENQRAQARVQNLLGLMRAASSSDGGIIAKGSGTGVAKGYRIRSCFAFGSIAVQLVQQSDRSRVTVLGIKKSLDPNWREQWEKVLACYENTISDEFINSLHARTIKLLPIIVANTRVFSSAAAAELGEQRSGDQIGALLAGAYSLTSESIITYDKALEWIRSKDWTEEKGLGNTKDETACLSFLLQQTVRVETEYDRVLDRTIGELIEIASGIAEPPKVEVGSQHITIIPVEKAVDRLKRFGVKIDNDYIVISNTSEQIKKALSATQWAHNHNKILLRVEGAKAYEATKFGAVLKTRAVGVPLDLMRN